MRRFWKSDVGFISRLANYFPGLIILVLGMIALHSAVSVIEHTPSPFGKSETWLYWSVLGMGLVSFILILMNGDKLNRLALADREKKENVILLKNRVAAIEASQDGIGIVDKDGVLTYMNKALITLHGIPESRLSDYIGKPWINLYSENGQREILEDVLPVVLTEKKWRGESPVERVGGEFVHAELSLTLLPDGGMIGTARDISDRHKNEKEKDQLEQQFYQAQKMEAVGRLAGGIAHDFNNVLAAINGYAEFLIEDLDRNTPQAKFAENILQAGRKAREIIDQILAFSRHKQSSKEALDLKVPINETLSMLRASMPKTIELTCFLSDDDTYIDGNAAQIAQVIMNLCVNARDAISDSEEGHGQIFLQLETIRPEDTGLKSALVVGLPEPGLEPTIAIEDVTARQTRLILGNLAVDTPYVRLTVQDSGTGMSRAIMEHIMEPFFTTKSMNKGTGLGLATVHGVIASHQGAMVIDSTLGKGTRFDIYFPKSQTIQTTKKGEDAWTDTSAMLSGQVLVVEDQATVRDMLVQMLERAGLDAQSCESGDEALTVLRDEPDYFDVVITDQNMPKVTGLELIQQIHAENPDLPFILVSGYSQERLQDLMRQHPAIKATLRKPVSKTELMEQIGKALKTRKKKAA